MWNRSKKRISRKPQENFNLLECVAYNGPFLIRIQFKFKNFDQTKEKLSSTNALRQAYMCKDDQ